MVGERVASARVKRQLTQEQRAALAGMRQSHISRIESGDMHVWSDTLAQMACVLGVTTDYPLGLGDDEEEERPGGRAHKGLAA
jgi:transcriptional regulator with XRE-family HTH domain